MVYLLITTGISPDVFATNGGGEAPITEPAGPTPQEINAAIQANPVNAIEQYGNQMTDAQVRDAVSRISDLGAEGITQPARTRNHEQ